MSAVNGLHPHPLEALCSSSAFPVTGMHVLPQDFLDISNPKAVLEMTLRGFSCLTRGDCICLHYNNKKYYIDITEAKPQVSKVLAPCYVPPLGASHALCGPAALPGLCRLV